MSSLDVVKMLMLGAAIYGSYAWVTFNPSFKDSWFLVPAGLALAIMGNLLWILIAKKTPNPADLTVYGMAWDAMITVSFVLVPVVLFGVRFSGTSGLGLILAILGIFLMKIGAA